MAWISTSVLFYAYSNIYILTELSSKDVKFISIDRQKLDLSKYIYFWYRKFYICSSTNIKNDPRNSFVQYFLLPNDYYVEKW